MKKNLLFAFVGILLFLPILVEASEKAENIEADSKSFDEQVADGEVEILSQTTKYYKNVTVYDTTEYETYALDNSRNSSQNLRAISSETIEVTPEEYFSIDPDTFQSVSPRAYTTVETTYLLLTTSIGSSGQYYLYSSTLSWKIMPSVRSYDVIAIGHHDNVKPVDGTTYCTLYYDYTSGGGKSKNSPYVNHFSTGDSCVIDLPTSDVKNIHVAFNYKVQKTNASSTVPTQIALGDYRHAAESVTIIEAVNHTVSDVNGIVFSGNQETKYQLIPYADCHWNASW